jgi:VanZ family protein
MRNRSLFAILFYTWLAALLVLTFYPNLPDLKIQVRHEWFRLDYIGHFGFYSGLIVIFFIWQAGWRARVPSRLIIMAVFGGSIIAVATEFSQLIIPGRSFNPIDMACNFAGILTGVIATYAWSRRAKNEC